MFATSASWAAIADSFHAEILVRWADGFTEALDCHTPAELSAIAVTWFPAWRGIPIAFVISANTRCHAG